jgi:hypothetical protein
VNGGERTALGGGPGSGGSKGAPVQDIVVRVGIPHFFREDGGGPGNGSRRPGARQSRALALARCLAGLQRLSRGGRDAVLHIGDRAIDHLAPEEEPLPPLRLEIVICTDGQHQLEEVLGEVRGGTVRTETLRPDDPVLLPLACRDLLIHSDPIADLTLYLEDDLVIDDAEYVDKQLWFLHQSEHRLCLMPHRLERLDQHGFGRLLVDGPLQEGFIRQFCEPRTDVARGVYRGQGPLSFDISANPHASTFALSRPQVEHLRRQTLPRSGFVGPIETASTLTVLQFFPVLKPSLRHRSFLTIEHAHPSFLPYLTQFPHRPVGGPSPAAP